MQLSIDLHLGLVGVPFPLAKPPHPTYPIKRVSLTGAFALTVPFVAMGPETAFLESDVASSEFAAAWDALCVKADTDEVQLP